VWNAFECPGKIREGGRTTLYVANLGVFSAFATGKKKPDQIVDLQGEKEKRRRYEKCPTREGRKRVDS